MFLYCLSYSIMINESFWKIEFFLLRIYEVTFLSRKIYWCARQTEMVFKIEEKKKHVNNSSKQSFISWLTDLKWHVAALIFIKQDICFPHQFTTHTIELIGIILMHTKLTVFQVSLSYIVALISSIQISFEYLISAFISLLLIFYWKKQANKLTSVCNNVLYSYIKKLENIQIYWKKKSNFWISSEETIDISKWLRKRVGF